MSLEFYMAIMHISCVCFHKVPHWSLRSVCLSVCRPIIGEVCVLSRWQMVDCGFQLIRHITDIFVCIVLVRVSDWKLFLQLVSTNCIFFYIPLFNSTPAFFLKASTLKTIVTSFFYICFKFDNW